MANFVVNQLCVACRGVIYSDVESTLLGFVDLEPKYSKKNKVLTGVSKAKELDTLCPACTEMMKGLIAKQRTRGLKGADIG